MESAWHESRQDDIMIALLGNSFYHSIDSLDVVSECSFGCRQTLDVKLSNGLKVTAHWLDRIC